MIKKPKWCSRINNYDCKGDNSLEYCVGEECKALQSPYQYRESQENDSVKHPEHYMSFPVEVIDIIKLVLFDKYGKDGYEAYCFGNEIKYRLRAGFKCDAQEDIDKALQYRDFRQ